MKKWLIIILAIVVVAIVVRIAIFGKKTAKEAVTMDIPVEAVFAGKGDVVMRSELIGTIAADKTAQVFPETMGRVTAILVRDGGYVAKDQPILTIKNETVGFEFETATVKSPINGAVAKILTDIGSMASPQAPVAIVVDFSTIKLVLNIAETDAGAISLNKRIKFTTDALPAEIFDATVAEISPVIDPMTRTVSVKATAVNPRGRLKPGMTCRVVVTTAERKGVLAIPRDAVSDGAVFVVMQDTLAERRSVKTGMIGDEYAEVTDGLKEGELVIIMGQQRLAGGEKIKVLVRK